jgi:hypothetical protein
MKCGSVRLAVLWLLTGLLFGCSSPPGDNIVPETVALEIEVSGQGKVTSDAGFECDGTCTESITREDTVTLQAVAAEGWVFRAWGGDCLGNDTCVLDMDAEKSVIATFKEAGLAPTPDKEHALTVARRGDGKGVIDSSPAGISCPPEGNCTGVFEEGTPVTLIATPDEGFEFAGWLGCDRITNGRCVVSLAGATNVTARFVTAAPPGMYILSVSKAGSGTGTVTSDPEGIDCGDDCSGHFTEGSTVTLTANPAQGSVFTEWKGCPSASGNSCTVVMTETRNVTATLAQAPTPDVASFTSSADIVVAGESMTFSWTVSSSDGATLSCTLEPGDGTPGYTRDCGAGSVQHTYGTGGQVQATLTVKHPAGTQQQVQTSVLVAARLFPADLPEQAQFGQTVATDGNLLVVGAPGNETQVRGKVYVYGRDGTGWAFQQELQPADGGPGDFYGHALALDGDTLVVGTDTYSNQDMRWMHDPAVYVYTRVNGLWNLQQRIAPPDRFDVFGSSVAVQGDILVVGARDKDGPLSGPGSAFVYQRTGTTWTLVERLQEDELYDDAGYGYGRSVALDGDTILVGASDASPGSCSMCSAVYVYTRAGDGWTWQQRLIPSGDAGEQGAGASLSLAGDTLAVRSRSLSDDDDKPMITLYRRSGGQWVFETLLRPADDESWPAFHVRDGEIMIAGRRALDLYVRGTSGWTLERRFTLSDDLRVSSLSRREGTLVLGNRNDRSAGRQAAGAVYVLDAPLAP